MAGKDNAAASEIDKTSFFWTGKCGGCHPGGGPGEFDRDGELYWDEAAGQFGYEKLGLGAGQVALDGDYAFLNPSSGLLGMAGWDKTGVSEPDCLMCHLSEFDITGGSNQNALWRQATLRAMTALVDDLGQQVATFAAAPAAGAGWHSTFELASLPPGSPPQASKLQLDYQVGLDAGELTLNAAGELKLRGNVLVARPRDQACWGCHATAEAKKRGRVWFDAAKDVHYAAFNHLDDADPANDGDAASSQACTVCHPSGADHEIAKGNAMVGSVRDDLDYRGFRTCRQCHLPGAERHPGAPVPTSQLHTTGGHLDVMSCEMCHIPFKEASAQLVIDNAVTGTTVEYATAAFLSGDPLDPNGPFDDKWYPSFHWKADEDGVSRIFPAKHLSTVWWGDWDENGTPGVLTDDVIQPLALWRVRQLTGNLPLPGTADDDGDGKVEVNTEAEILSYLTKLKQADGYGVQVAANPVLVKGGKIWYEDPAQRSGVNHFEHHGTGIKVESLIPFGIDHNVREPMAAIGALGNCDACHRGFNGGQLTPTFDRLILVDPFDENGQPVYETTRVMLGINPF